MTAYNNAKALRESLSALLAQEFEDFSVVVADDCSSDETPDVLEEFVRLDSRVSFVRNTEWKGMLENWRLVFSRAQSMHSPDFFAWVSDHDYLESDWLLAHMEAMKSNINLALVYSTPICVDVDGKELSSRTEEPFSTVNMRHIDALHNACTRQSGAGNAVYGLFRSKALEDAGVFRDVTLPDRLLLAEICNYGQVQHLEGQFWTRRNHRSGEVGHQEEILQQVDKLYGKKPIPFHAYAPLLSHAVSLLWTLSILPNRGKYDRMPVGWMMAGSIWECYHNRKQFIRLEVELLKRFAERYDFYSSLPGSPGDQDVIYAVVRSVAMTYGAVLPSSKVDTLELLSSLMFLKQGSVLARCEDASKKLAEKKVEISSLKQSIKAFDVNQAKEKKEKVRLRAELKEMNNEVVRLKGRVVDLKKIRDMLPAFQQEAKASGRENRKLAEQFRLQSSALEQVTAENTRIRAAALDDELLVDQLKTDIAVYSKKVEELQSRSTKLSRLFERKIASENLDNGQKG